MSAQNGRSRSRGVPWKLSSLHERIGHYYYSHCLFCSTYPVTVISVAVVVTLICCYPLTHLPLPANLPLHTWSGTPNVTTGRTLPFSDPLCYVQQVVVRSSVVPWRGDLTVGDAFRAPIYESFKLLDIVRNFEDTESSKTFGDVCLHVESSRDEVFPQYSCLVLSPANFWQQDVQRFTQDKSPLSTIFSYQDFQKGATSTAEMLLGMPLKNTGVKRYPVRSRQRLIQYALTLFYKTYDERFIEGLRTKLARLYPLFNHQNGFKNGNKNNNTAVVFYPEDLNYYEFIPLTGSFILMFLYYYFSVRKIDFIKSRFGLAFTALMTVLGSLTMTMGVCFFFGVSLSLQGKEVFPYLVIIVGLENVLVLTKSVLATPCHLDAKIRVAQGMSREGWSITKNLLLEITILTVGLCTFVPAIQEFCIFAITGLIADFFLQMLFFSTVLGIDIRRMENEIEKLNPNFRSSLYQSHLIYQNRTYRTGMNRSKSHPRLSSSNVSNASSIDSDKKIPKRLRLVNVWARTRFFQRAFMILMVVWIVMFAYKSGIVENYLLKRDDQTMSHEQKENTSYPSLNLLPLPQTDTQVDITNNYYSEEVVRLKHPDYEPWTKLSMQHWSSILMKYNISLGGRSVVILPTITVSHVVVPEQAVLLRNPDEKYSPTFRWQTLAAALDPIDYFGAVDEDKKPFSKSKAPLYPTSPMEIFLTAILCVISIIVITYTLIVLYRCICSRNYAEWRASWWNERAEDGVDPPVLLEVLPVVVEGHMQQIECIATDGFTVVSCCLGGHLKIWDSNTGEQLAYIDRNMVFEENKTIAGVSYDEVASDYGSCSPPSRDEQFCTPSRLRKKINMNFSTSRIKKDSLASADGFDFSARIRNEQCNSSRSNCEAEYGTCDNCSNGDWPERLREENGDFLRDDSVTITRIPAWCIDYLDNLIAVGCANGQVEFWEGTTGKLKCVYDNGDGVGATAVKIVGSRVLVAFLQGVLEFLQLQTFTRAGKPIDWNFTCAYRRTHVRTGSAGSISNRKDDTTEKQMEEDELRCLRVAAIRAHQQPIGCMDSEGGRVVTGGHDHTVKVFRLEDGGLMYTLHGHCGPVTCLFVDRVSPVTAGSGSQDGMLCVWDLLTGTCMYSVQAHNGCVASLTYSASYVISLGSDERLCIWERFQGHLLNTIGISSTFSSQVVMLTPHLVITARGGVLVVFDVRSGENVRTITLGSSPFVLIKQLIALRDVILCDYGNQLRIVRFPLITRKYD